MPVVRRQGRARPVITGRALVLGTLVVLLVVVLASPIHRYLGSRGAVHAAATQLRDDRAQQRDLTKRKALWSDPGYIEQQARRQLQFAMPGDTVYVVSRPGEKTGIEQTRGGSASSKAGGTGWNSRLWDSVTAAGR